VRCKRVQTRALDDGSVRGKRERMPRQKILVAMSGGVDSSVAAGLLHEAGHELVGVTLHLWDAEGESKVGRCCAPEDRDDARRTADHLGIPHYVIDERASFRTHVVEPFLDAYASGTTPSPCVHCNKTVKLTFLTRLADELGASHIATGHYARVDERGRLREGADRHKDQSYFLFGLPEPVRRRLMFPLGELEKTSVRAEGRRLGIPNADKPDSQELCFVPDGNIRGFHARERGAEQAGRIVDREGNELAVHSGISGYTVGQRKGLGLGGGPTRYVLKVVPDQREVLVGPEADLYSRRFVAREPSWLDRPEAAIEARVRIRYKHPGSPALVVPTDDGFEVEFKEPERAITPGQAAVVYRGDEVLGGGFIASSMG
jgi:tRNA-specific 2-thiouridylase